MLVAFTNTHVHTRAPIPFPSHILPTIGYSLAFQATTCSAWVLLIGQEGVGSWCMSM